MAQSIITAAFEAYKAQQESALQPVALDEFVLAYVPEQDHNAPIDPNESLPSEEQIVHIASVTQSGYVNPNAVAYSLLMDTKVGDFTFNWIGLRNKQTGILAAISHIPPIEKLKNEPGVKNGNAVTRSILMSYQDAKALTGITVDASTWQIDFTARLLGIDENERLVNLDVFGHGAFLGDGFKVVKSGLTYSVTQGRGYVGGLRCHLDADGPLTGVVGGVSIYLDASWQGHVTSQWKTVFSVKVTDEALTDYIGADGYQHYVTKLADVDAAGNVTDCRYLEGFAQYYRQSALDEMLGKKVDQAAFDVHKHNASDINAGTLAKERLPDASTSAKGAVTLTDSTSSSSSSLAATAKAVKSTYDKAVSAYNLASEKWKAVNASTSAYGIVKLATSVSSTSTSLAATSSAVKTAYDKAVSAYNLANGKWSAVNASTSVKGIVQLSTSVSSTSTALAATASAVKAAYDKAVSAYNLANGKWSAVNASTSTRGIVQLSTSASSSSTSTAATSSAVKAAMDKANSAISQASGNAVYTGSSASNTSFPIGTNVIAFIRGGKLTMLTNGNHHEQLHLSTYSSHDTYVYSGYTYAGSALLGTWAYRGRTGTSHSVALGLYQRVA